MVLMIHGRDCDDIVGIVEECVCVVDDVVVSLRVLLAPVELWADELLNDCY